jgi:hypothetical protein
LAVKRAVRLGLVAAGLIGVGLGVALWRTRSSRPTPPPASPFAGSAGTVGGPIPARVPDAGADGKGSASDFVTAAAEIGARLYKCAPAEHFWRKGRLVLAKLEFSPAGALVRGLVLDPQIGERSSLLASLEGCFARALASNAADTGAELTTVWFPLVFAEPHGQDGGAKPSQEPPEVDLLALPSPYPRADLPTRAQGLPWLALCGDGKRPRTWRPVTLHRTTDEDNESFDDVTIEGCGADPGLVPAVRGIGIVEQPVAARVVPGPRSSLGERTIRFSGRRFQIWQEKTGEDASIIVLGFGHEIQVLIADTEGDAYDLIWAGDLDGDHQLDLIVRDADPDAPRVTLFLSSQAPTALPVGRATDAVVPGD